jgi:Major tropism determinant N-terminal domain
VAISILHKRGVDVNRPVLADGELYFCTDTKRVFHGSVPNRIPSQAAVVDLTAQSAAKTATTILTPTVTGLYRISVYLKITTVGSTSSTLGGATGVIITYTDGTDSVAQSQTCALQTQAGLIAINNAANLTSTKLLGDIVIYAKTGVAIQYAIGYTSSGTAMQYEAHLAIEAM